jgi:hypothetical protein
MLKQFYGSQFKNCGACIDANIASAAEIKHQHPRTQTLLAHLRTLPPWPEPLPSPPYPPEPQPKAPKQRPLPELLLTPDDRVDAPTLDPTPEQIADARRRRLFDRFKQEVSGAWRRIDRYPELLTPLRSLRDELENGPENADILFLHLDLVELLDLEAAQAAQSPLERWDEECARQIARVLSIGPGITMDHPDVAAHERQEREFRRLAPATGPDASEARIARDVSQDAQIATEAARMLADRLADASEGTRRAELRKGFVHNAVLIGGTFLLTKVGDAVAGHVVSEGVKGFAQFFLTHREDLLAVAQSWGLSGQAWLGRVLQAARVALGRG